MDQDADAPHRAAQGDEQVNKFHAPIRAWGYIKENYP